MDVSIPEAFGYSLLGIAVVFIVLIFLMFIVWLMSLILKPKAAKLGAAGVVPETTVVPEASQAAIAEPSATVPGTAGAEGESERYVSMETTFRHFSVMINGVEHIVDAAEMIEDPPAVEGKQ
ncbi:MAG: OadG family protein [Oscillospiraceae bacterium]|jgi:Na+-transporting methylmalonyl-CoA/oxaloacetate decarboxylase gamma subunit|nr:OadG family protein [Oscillospiraceae bacterium]